MAETNARPERLYLPGIDAMRGIVVIIGMLFHANAPLFKTGLFFVDVFGVLSGYLITRVLLGEKLLTGKINYRRFYLARARRLLPVLFATLVAVILYARALEPKALWDLRAQTLAAVGYVYNWYAIFSGGDYFTSYDIIPIQHIWSLSLEEQFYAVWPVAIAGLMLLAAKVPRTVKYIPYGLLALALGSAYASWAIYHGGDTTGTTDMMRAPLEVFGFEGNRLLMTYMSTITRAGGFLVGAALAFWWQPELRRETPGWVNKTIDVAGLLSLVAVFVLTNLQAFTPNVHAAVVNGGAVGVWVICAVLIVAFTKVESRWLHFLVTRKPLVRLGIVSYALYLFHWPVMQFYREYPFKPINLLVVLAFFSGLWIVAELSQKYFERPIRRVGIKAWLSGMRPAARTGVVSVSVLLSLAAVASLVTAPRETDTFREQIDGSADATDGVEGGQTVRAVAIGDSITALLNAEYAERGVVVDATVARSFAEGSGIAAYLAEQGQVSEAIIVHLGTNEEITPEALRRMLDATASVPRVVLVTLWREGWNLLEPNNANIRSMAAAYPNVVVADWNRIVTADPSLMMRDGIHISQGAGHDAYMRMIEKAIASPGGSIVEALP
jgi:peptidoglycan/LPS O-acetylase OafA/YrhL